MDRLQLSAVVYKKTGVALGSDDPAFALVELNRLALKEAIEETAGQIMERLNAFPERIRASGSAVAAEVASQGMQRVVEMLAESRRTIAADTEQAQRRIADHTAKLNEPLAREVAAVMRAAQNFSRASAARSLWLVATVAMAIISCVCGFIGGLAAGAHNLFRLTGMG
jgi:hypothetical protein